MCLQGVGVGAGATTRVWFCWRTERKQKKPGVGGTSEIGDWCGAGLGCHTKVTQRRFLPKVTLILPRPSPAGGLAWHLALPAKSHGTDLMLCYTWALLLILQRERESAHLQEPLWMPAPDLGTKACLEGRQRWRTKGGLNPAPPSDPQKASESFSIPQTSWSA